MIVYDGVAKIVKPKKEQLEIAETSLAKVIGELNKKKAELKEVQDNVAKLLSEFDTAKKKKDDLEVQVDDCSKRLVRAEKLISGLGGEKTRWHDRSAQLGGQYNNITGDVLISSGIVAYLGAFMGKYRQEMVGSWVDLMHQNKVPSSAEFSLRHVIGEDVAIRQWVIDKLPNDQVSIENALILSKSRRWPLMIDPQMQANQWIRKSNADKKLKVIRLNQQNYARILENSISYGEPVLLENVGEVLDPLLDPLLQKAKFKAGNIVMIRLGDSTIEYSEEFRLFITTKLPNPHYPPEVCVQVTLLNFMATPDGLEDQMLGILVAKEEPEVERKRQNLIVESAQSKAQLKEIEDRILELLSNAKGNILDDEELINTLATSKVASQRIEERVAEQEKTQALVQETREAYVPVAVRASALFFVVSELCVVEPMYQYSLEWFIGIYLLAIATAEKFERNVQKRLVSLQKQFVKLLYEKVCDSLFEKDKLMFSLLLAFKSMEVDSELNYDEKNLLLLACSGTGLDIDKPHVDWLTPVSWQRLCELEKLGKGPWVNFTQQFKGKLDQWRSVFDSDNPAEAPWPGGVKDNMTPLQRALVLLAVRTDCTITGIQEVIAGKLGPDFLEPPSFNLEKSFNDSSAVMPLIFVLSPGADPMAEINRLGVKVGMNDRQNAVSLGQGQGKKAAAAVQDGLENGFWTILQNCHLAPSWMPTLEVIVEGLAPDKVDPQFRLWLTAMPSPEFPVSVLQNGLKMTNEPPKGLKSNLLRAYLSFDEDWFDEACKKSEGCQHAFRKMLFGLCFFHALIQERCNYGALGWNIPYQFSEPDRQICMSQLQMFLEENVDIPYAALCYTAAEANYGGRVTDTHDRRCIAHILTDFYCPEMLQDSYRFSPSGVYYAPPFTNLEGYVEYIRALPINQMPEAFGLHANANLVAAINEAMKNLKTACSMQPASGAGEGGRSTDDLLVEGSKKFLSELPQLFDTEAINAKYPVEYTESMNTVLKQELLRFNRLLARVRSTLVDIDKAVQGLVVMTPELDDVANGMLTNKLPSAWSGVSYPSLKPMSSYVVDLAARLKFLNDWVDAGVPATFWISGFFFTQSFLTGQLQNFARKFTLPIDMLVWTFKVLRRSASDFQKPPTGCLVYGLFIDGARWDDNEGVIAESLPKVLFDSIPHIHIVPCETSKDTTDKKMMYTSPVYKTSERKGTLSTTGHSTNFVMSMLLPIARQHNEKYWTKRGVACLTQLDD
jgi:dynein heavy chain